MNKMTELKETKTATKINVLYDVRVEADLSGMVFNRHYKTKPEEMAEYLDEAVKEFERFLRDHRSRDMVKLTVNRIYKDICSACQGQWETDSDENGLSCANCGARISTEAVKI